MDLRKELHRALDPGPGFPSPGLWSRTLERLDEEPAVRRPVAIHVTAALGIAVLCLSVVAVLLSTRLALIHRPTSPAAGSTSARAAGPAALTAGFVTTTFVTADVGWVAQFAPSGVTHVSRTSDGGRHWTEVRQMHGLTPGTPAATFANTDQAVVVGQPALASRQAGITVYLTLDSTHWVAHEAPVSMGYLRQASFLNPREGWVIASPNRNQAPNETRSLWLTGDGGQHWDRLTDSTSVAQLADERTRVSFDTDQIGWLYGGGSGELMRTEDAGRLWSVVLRSSTGPPFAAVARPASSLVQVSLSDGTAHAYRTRDGGLSWTDAGSMPAGSAFFATARRWLVANGSGLAVSNDGGATFTEHADLPLPKGWIIRTVAAADDGTITVVVGDAPRWVAASGGSRSANSAQPIDSHIQGTIPRAQLVRSLDGGRTWAPIEMPDLP